jgi:tripartite-type tricarboxylate transporter receptor subunit TctC
MFVCAITASGPVEAPKLDAISCFVNMPDSSRDLRLVAIPAGGGRAINNENIGRDTMDRWIRMAATAAVMLGTYGTASAQAPFPSKPVHIFVPYSAGGAVDILSRTLGDAVSRQWGQSVVIENRPGAGGVVASQALVTSPPDGYTLIVVASGHPTNAFLYAKLPYDTFKDFTPISQLASSPNILLVRADSPFKTLGDMIAQAKAKPGTLSFGHSGNGTSTHLAGELLKNLARIDIAPIPYKGGLPVINDLLGGQIPMSINNGPESVGQLEAGTLRALAVTTASRASFLPNVPSMAETVPGYDTEVWWGLLGPAGMPPEVVAKLSHDFVAALQTEEVKARLAKLGAMPIGSSPAQFDAKIHADYDKWGPIIKAAGIKAE